MPSELEIAVQQKNSNNTDSLIESSDKRKIYLGVLKEKITAPDIKVKQLIVWAKKRNIGKEIITGNPKEAEYYTTYLGEIEYNGQPYHVFKLYFDVQAAIEKHGHSEIIVLRNQEASYYDMEMTENLPIDLKNGQFRFIENNDTLNMKIELITETDLLFSEL